MAMMVRFGASWYIWVNLIIEECLSPSLFSSSSTSSSLSSSALPQIYRNGFIRFANSKDEIPALQFEDEYELQKVLLSQKGVILAPFWEWQPLEAPCSTQVHYALGSGELTFICSQWETANTTLTGEAHFSKEIKKNWSNITNKPLGWLLESTQKLV